MKHYGKRRIAALALLASGAATASHGSQVHVAVAANFAVAAEEIGRAFEAETGHKLLLSTGSTGKLYAQIANGAPFEVFLAADVERPAKLEAVGHAVAGTRFTYALGQLVLWSPRPGLVDDHGAVLAKGGFRHLALTNPTTAPYGAAARQVLEKLGLWDKLGPLRVQGENVGQTFQFVASGNAELGFIALSQLSTPETPLRGSHWVVPAELHDPLEQQAVLLNPGAGHPAARAFLEFLRGEAAGQILDAHGYGRPPRE
jgi:molybdate transport system substrate-binding protein